MFNVTVINKKDIIKYLVVISIAIIIVISIARYFSFVKEKINIESGIQSKIQTVTSGKSYTECLDEVIPAIEKTNKNETVEVAENENQVTRDNILQKLLQVELSSVRKKENSPVNQVDNEQKQQEEINTNVSTEVVTENPIEANPTDSYGNVEIRNQTGYVLTEEMLKPDIEVDTSNIVIYHTHTCESYTPTDQNQYEMTGSYRTTDLAYSVARVGDELTDYLSKDGYNVIHDKTYHDYPAYSGSYNRSLETIEEIQKTANADIVIDLHRDAIGSNSDYAPTVKIGDDYAAQLMFVIGTDGGGLWHPNWNQNLKFAVKIQQKAEELYPGLFKPIILRNARYNQHVAKAATIIEVGATGNTLEQCLTSMKYLKETMNQALK